MSPHVTSTALAYLTDGVLVSGACLALVLTIVIRQLRDVPRWGWGVLAVTVAVGALLRIFLPVEAQLEGPYANTRVFPLAESVYNGPVLAALSRTGRDFYLTDVIFGVNLAIAIVSPLVLFAHARFVLKDFRSALAAAVLLAFLPLHIRFARSDVSQMQAAAASSFMFLVLYAALRDPSRWMRGLCLVLVPLLSLATYYSRPENIVFFPLDMVALAVASGKDIPRRRTLIAGSLITVVAVFTIIHRSIPQSGSHLDVLLNPSLPLSTIYLLLNPWRNALINPWATPPVLLVLAVVGGIALYRRGERFRSLFLAGWFACFFAIQSAVIAQQLAHNARYHLTVVTPLVLLAAAATPTLLTRSRTTVLAVTAMILTAPLVNLGFIRDMGYYEIEEFQFLTRLRQVIPDGCTVLEFQPDADEVGQVDASRVDRVAERVHQGRHESRWNVIRSGVRAAGGAYEELSPEARRTLASPSSCLAVYEGLTCVSDRPATTLRAPVCEALRQDPRRALVLSTSVRARGYDDLGVNGRILEDSDPLTTAPGITEQTEVTYALYALTAPLQAVTGQLSNEEP